MSIEQRTAAREALLKEQLCDQRRLAKPEDYVFDKSQEKFWDMVDGTIHTEKAVDASIPLEYWRVEVLDEGDDQPQGKGRPRKRKEKLIPPSKDIQRVENDQLVEGSTWWPGRPKMIKDWFIDSDGFYPSAGRRIYNQYKSPPTLNGDHEAAEPWIEHVKKLWPDPIEHEFFFNYCAHMAQRPEEKCNAAIVLSGAQGIGKDACLLPVKAAVGSWNTKGIDPDELFSPYKPWLQTLMLVVDEVRPSKDEFHASSMYNILKPMIVAPPNTLPLNDKYVKLRYVINVMRVFITTNDWMAMYIPKEDRRLFIMHSVLQQKWNELEGQHRYFDHLFKWFEEGGTENVAAWLRCRDISGFNPKAQAPRTRGWEAVATTWGEPEDCVSQALDILQRPPIIFPVEMVRVQFDGVDDLRGMLKSPRKIGHRMQRAGYIGVPKDDGSKWLFKVGDRRVESKIVFVKQELVNGNIDLKLAIKEHAAQILSPTTDEAAAG